MSDDVVYGQWKNVPSKWLSPSLWRCVYCGQVSDLSVPNHLKEAEAALFVAKHLVRSGNSGQGQRHLVLGDSVLGKGRASDSRPVARKWACISIAGDFLLVHRWIPSDINVADADSRRWENDDEAHDSKIVRNSHLSPASVENVRPPCHLISDDSPWMEYCAEQNPGTTNHGCKGQRAKKSPIRRLVRWEQPTQHDPHGSRPQVGRLAPSSTSVPDGSDRSSGQEGPLPQFIEGRLRISRRMQQRSSGSLEYLDILFTQGSGPELGSRLLAAIRMMFPRYSRHGDLDMLSELHQLHCTEKFSRFFGI